MRLIPHSVTAVLIGAARAAGRRLAAVDAGRDRHLRRLHRDPRRRPPADPARARLAQRGHGARRPRPRGAGRRGPAAAPVRARDADGRGHGLRRGGLGGADAVPARARARRAGVPGRVPARAGGRRDRAGAPAGAGARGATSLVPALGRRRSSRSARGSLVGPFALLALLAGVVRRARAGARPGWRLRDGRLAVRSLRDRADDGARPGAVSASRTRVSQNVFQRRAGLADLRWRSGRGRRRRSAPGRGRRAVGVGRAVAPANCALRGRVRPA